MNRFFGLLLIGFCAAGSGCEDPPAATGSCDGVTCSNHGQCVLLDDRPTCACEEGHMPDGLSGLSCVPLSGEGGASGAGGQDASGGIVEPGGRMATGGSMAPGGAMGPGGMVAGGVMAPGGTVGSGGSMIPDRCQGITCSRHGICVVLDDQPTCACDDGYAPDPVNGLSCVPFTPNMWADAATGPPRDFGPSPDVAFPLDAGPVDGEVPEDAQSPLDGRLVRDGAPPLGDSSPLDAVPPLGDWHPRDAEPDDAVDAAGDALADSHFRDANEGLDGARDAEVDSEFADAAIDADPDAGLVHEFVRCDGPYCLGDDQVEDEAAGIFCREERLPFWPSLGTTGADGRMERRSDEPGEPVVVDHLAGLTWMGCPVGVTGQNCTNGIPQIAPGANHPQICSGVAWGGHDDWVEPTGVMVESLMDRQRTYGGVFNAELFPYPASTRLVRLDHDWTGRAISSYSAYVDARTGRTRLLDRGRGEDNFQVYCVRATDGGPPPTVIRRCFRRDPETPEPTVEDLGTGLTWTACASGLTGQNCDAGQNLSLSHRQAVEYCETLDYAGHDDWTMPTVDQLNSLTDDTSEGRDIQKTGFASDILHLDVDIWALDRAGYYGYASFYFLSNTRPLYFEHQIDATELHTLCVRGDRWTHPLEYPGESCREVTPLRLDAHWEDEQPRLVRLPGGPDSPGDPIVRDALYGIDWTGCLSGARGDDCDGGIRVSFPAGPDPERYCRGLEWGGHADWRLPEYRELAGLVDFTSREAPPLAPSVGDAFPALLHENGYIIFLRDGGLFNTASMTRTVDGRFPASAYCVRDWGDGPPKTEIQCVETNAWHAQEPTVTDPIHGHQWTACPTGGNGRDCIGGQARRARYAGAIITCEELNWAGQDDWRVPTVAEFARLIDQKEYADLDYSDVEAFPFTANAPATSYWTQDLRSDTHAWVARKYPNWQSLPSTHYVRCVRDL